MPLVPVANHDAVRVLTLNRPEARNALSRDLIRATYAALTEADADEAVRAVVLTGADPAFCAGVDLKEAQRDGLKYFEKFRSQSCIAAVANMRTPIIGAINGATFTGELEMALGCDFLVASERAVFADTHARVGILPGGGMTARLPQIVGVAMARRLSMTGEVVDAARAERIGLVTEVVAHDLLLDRTIELASQIQRFLARLCWGSKRSTRRAPPRLSTPRLRPRRRSPSPSIAISTALAISSASSPSATSARSTGDCRSRCQSEPSRAEASHGVWRRRMNSTVRAPSNSSRATVAMSTC